MPPKKNKQLKSFGKNRREIQPKAVCGEDGHWTTQQHQDSYRVLENALFNRYYKELQQLGLVSKSTPSTSSSLSPNSEADAFWEREMELFRQPLPTTLWVNDADPLSTQVRAYFESVDSSMVEPIPWYPIKGMGWRILADKTSFRKREDMQGLRQFLIQQTALGTISRQEEVSMIPPFLLDIQPTDVCLDMCASPGSKTAQMLVGLARHKIVSPGSSLNQGFPYDYLSEGMVVANELDAKRANMLVHQVKRMRLLFPFAVFTNHDARYFPELRLESPKTATTEEESPCLRFDKILCDVVCSGDGTLRKAPHIFKIWTPFEAMKLQKIQIQIALRAAHLLKVGGRLVYSTCSLNPVENEAVVAQIIHRTRGAMRLVDGRHLLPHLSCSPGMNTWVVMNQKGEVITEPIPGTMHEALFPPKTRGGYSSPAVDGVDLSLCMRLLPTHCAGGGFFVAVLDKVEEFQLTKREMEEEGRVEKDANKAVSRERKVAEKEIRPHDASVDDDVAPFEQPLTKKPRLAPPQFFTVPPSIQSEISEFLELCDFPMDHVMVRAPTGEREVRMTPGSVCSFVSTTAGRLLSQKTDSLVVVSAGLRLFAHESLTKGWRIAAEAASLFSKFMKASPRTVHVSVEFMQTLLMQPGNQKRIDFERLKEINSELFDVLQALPTGPIFLIVHMKHNTSEEKKTDREELFYTAGLRARACLQLLVDHEDLEGVRLRLGLPPLPSIIAAEPENEEKVVQA